MPDNEPKTETWQYHLSDDDQKLINRIKQKIASGKTVTLMQENWGRDAKAYPPTPLKEIEEAERELGFRFPALIREIWLQVGNGGFGPGYGITGVETGEQIYDTSLVNLTKSFRQYDDYLQKSYEDALTEAHLSEENRLYADDAKEELEQWYWNNTCIAYCYWGCNVTTAVDCGDPTLPIHAIDAGYIDLHSSKTLRQFWNDWLDGSIDQY